jgi:uncharacterized protein YndB with AHSA1/START domain
MTEFAVEVTRTIPGAREDVYRAFLDPDVLQKWFCPGEFAVVTASVDEHVGGRHVVEMLEPDGTRLAFESVIRDLVENERIVLDFAFVGPEPREREETLLTVTLSDAPGGGTDVRFDHERITLAPPNFDRPGVNAGWTSVLDKLEALYERSR